MRLVHEIPSEFNDEDKWFKWFTKRSMLYIVAGLGSTYLLYRLFMLIHHPFIGIIIGAIITVTLGAISMIPIPEGNYLKGSGQTVDVILIRRWIRRGSKTIYTKGYGKDK